MRKKLVSFILEAVAKLRVRRFSEAFWPIFDSFLGGYIRMLILPPKKKSESGSKIPENRLNLSFAIASLCVSFFSASLYAGSVHLMNDSPFILRGVIRGADGTFLGETLVQPQNMSTWNDWNAILGTQGMGPYTGGNFYSQTPYTVIWYCMDGHEYGINNNVGAGATVLAQYSDGPRACSVKAPKQGAYPNQPQGYLNEQHVPEADRDTP